MTIYDSLQNIAKRRGIEVHEQLMPGAIEGLLHGLYIEQDDQCVIIIDKALPDEDKAFVLAHELGHHQLHRGKGYIFHKTGDNDIYEAEADRFAERLIGYLKTKRKGRGPC